MNKINGVNKINILDDSTTEIEIIYHISDVHIKVNISEDLKQHYINLFDQISTELESAQKNTPNNFIVVITGDVIDTTYSVECINMIHTFFNKLVQYCDVFYIKGNHCLSNKRNVDGPDMITPLISNYNEFNLKHKIYSLLDGGLYQYNNIMFAVTKMGSSEICKCKCDTKKKFIKVGLHHGQVAHQNMDKIVKKQCKLNEEQFTKEYDITLLGDCHSMKFLNEKKNIAYSGSLYEVNYREASIDKGILKWNLKNRTADFIKINGTIKHVILPVINGKLEGYKKITKPTKVKFKVIYDLNTKFEKLEEIQKKLQSENDTLEILFEKDNSNNCLITDITMGNNKKKINEIKTFEIVIKMITDHIKENNKCDKQIIVDINNYLKKLSENVNFNFFEKETTFRLKKLQFDNINSYGTNNIIDFDFCINKICEISGLNGIGKSTVLTVLLLGLYNECDVGTKYDCLNVKGIVDGAKIIIDFEVDSNLYQIKKIFNVKSHARRECKEDLYLLKNGKDITGRDNIETQKKINNLIGTYENIIDTNIVLQRNYKAFTDLSNNDKKRVIFKLSRLDVFDVLAKHVRCELMSLQKKIPMITKQIKDVLGNHTEENILSNTNKIKKELNDLQIEKKLFDATYGKLNKDKIELEFELKNDLNNSDNLDTASSANSTNSTNSANSHISKNITLSDANIKLTNLNAQLIDLNKELEKYKKQLNDKKFDDFENKKKEFDKKLKLKLDTLIEEKNNLLLKITNVGNFDESEQKNKINRLEEKISNKKNKIVDTSDNSIIKSYEKFINLEKENIIVNNQICKIKKDIKKYKEKQENVKKIDYDESCKFCIKLKNKITFEENIEILKKELEIEKNKKNKIDANIDLCGKNCKTKYDEHIQSIENNKNLENEINLLAKDLCILKKEYEKNISLLKDNKKYSNEINILDKNISECKNESLLYSEDYCKLNDQVNTISKKIFKIKTEIEKYNQIVNNFENIKKTNRLKEINSDYIDVTKKIKTIQNEIDKKTKTIVENEVLLKQTKGLKEELEILKKEKQIVELVNKSLDKDGIQDTILVNHIIPKLQMEINNLLNVLANFSIEIKYLNKTLQVYKIVNKNEKILKLSGYEHMILGLCFRMVFCNLTHQQCKFVCLDEIFTFADDMAIQKIHHLFDYIRNNFEFALIISHNDSIKKYCDVSFDIEKQNGFSKIVVTDGFIDNNEQNEIDDVPKKKIKNNKK